MTLGAPPATQATSPNRQLTQVEDLVGPEGRLEALLNHGRPGATCSAVLCHPYPPAGGTMHTKVVYHAMKVLSAAGIPVLRFNFRGVGLSAGAFDAGHGEAQDVRVALDWLDARFGLPILFAGFSFGANVGLHATCGDARVIGKVALGLPLRAAGRDYRYDFLRDCSGPLLAVNGAEDEFCTGPQLHQITATVAAETETVLIEGADHFFQGVPTSPATKLPQMQAALLSWLQRQGLARS